MKNSQVGELPPQYSFILNPYPDVRCTSCPECGRKTGQRKVPLLIHVAPTHLIALNYTCRYCRHCDLLVGHKHDIERLLYELFSRVDPQVIGNDYLIVGTVEKAAWREGVAHPRTIQEMLPHAHDFKRYLGEVRMTRGGWYPRDVEPPVAEPPKSQEWVKGRLWASHRDFGMGAEQL